MTDPSIITLAAHFGHGYLAWNPKGPRGGSYCLMLSLPEGRAGWHVTEDLRHHLQLHGVPVIDREESPPSKDDTARVVRRTVVSQRINGFWSDQTLWRLLRGD